MTTYTNKLFVIGGNHFRGSTDYDDVLDCEYYQPAIDQWTRVSPMLTGQSDVGIAVYNDKIYVTGGYSWNNRCMVDIVQCYCPNSDKWETQFSLPEALGGIRACTLGKWLKNQFDRFSLHVTHFFLGYIFESAEKAEAGESERVACNVNQTVDFLNQKSFTKAPTRVYKSRTAFSIDYRYKN